VSTDQRSDPADLEASAERAVEAAEYADMARSQVAEARTEAVDAREQTMEAREEAVEARSEAQAARVGADRALAGAVEARAGAIEAAEAVAVAADDPLLDTAVRRLEAKADEENPFGRPGRPLNSRSPFRVGFAGALGVALAYSILQALIHARQVLILLVISAFLAIGLNPTVAWLERRGLGRKSAIALVFAGVILFFVGFGFAVVPPVVNQSSQFVHELPTYLDKLQHNSPITGLNNRFHFLEKAKAGLTGGGFGTSALGGVVGVGKIVLGAFFSFLTILILTLYFLGSFHQIKATAYRMVPRSRRARVGLLADEILDKVGGYVAGALTIAGIAGTAAFVFLLIAGVPYPLALAMLVAVTDLIPLIGATLGAIVVTAVCFFVSVQVGIAAAAFFIIYQQVENFLIYPRVMGRSVEVSGTATLVAALTGGALLGVVGALLAIPTAAALQLVLREVVVPRQDSR
jgi:predicted PurR-regulated permease PerM